MLLGVCVTLSSVRLAPSALQFLLRLSPYPRGSIVGTDIAHAVPLTLIAGSVTGPRERELFPSCRAPGRLFTRDLAGTQVANHLPDRIMRPILATLLMGLKVRFALF